MARHQGMAGQLRIRYQRLIGPFLYELKENPVPSISNDKFSQEVIFNYWDGRLSGHTHVICMSALSLTLVCQVAQV